MAVFCDRFDLRHFKINIFKFCEYFELRTPTVQASNMVREKFDL